MDTDDKTTVLNVQNLASDEEHRSACFIVLTGGQAGRMYKLEHDETFIGRSSEAGIRIDDDGVSRRHARIIRRPDGAVVLSDAGSTNGTFCNGEKIYERTLHDGDKVQIGTTTILKFSYQDSIEEDFQRRQYESATRDALTRCYNKKYFLERLPNEIAFALRHVKPVSLAMFDIDHFKLVNDTYGHRAGDAVLHNVAQTIQGSIRADDVLARYGGEEFALIMRETPLAAAFIAVERIRRRVEAATVDFDGRKLKVTVSCGVATCVDDALASGDKLVQAADVFLYRAKNSGRNRTECELVS